MARSLKKISGPSLPSLARKLLMKRSAVGGLTRDTSFDLVLSIILRDGSGLSRGGFGFCRLFGYWNHPSLPITTKIGPHFIYGRGPKWHQFSRRVQRMLKPRAHSSGRRGLLAHQPGGEPRAGHVAI